jgi:hypothetical protein
MGTDTCGDNETCNQSRTTATVKKAATANYRGDHERAGRNNISGRRTGVRLKRPKVALFGLAIFEIVATDHESILGRFIHTQHEHVIALGYTGTNNEMLFVLECRNRLPVD